jgi:hypothetical protein
MKVSPQAIILVILLSSTALPSCHGDPDQSESDQGGRGEKIHLMVVGRYIELLRPYLDPEPSIDYVFIPFRLVDLSAKDAIKFLRLYFPRTYQEMGKYDVLILNSPDYQMFTPTQDRWMHDAIEEGMGGINAGSVFSIIAEICLSWADSQTSTAFPNDAVTVAYEKGGGTEMNPHFMVTINDAYPDQVLQPYLPFKVEDVPYIASSRFVIPKEGAGILAWQSGNHPTRVAYLIAWEYGRGVTMTCGNVLPKGFFDWEVNEYGPDLLMNMMLYMAQRDLITDVLLYHGLKSTFVEYNHRIVSLISLRDFVDNFGANTQPIQKEIRELDQIYRQGYDLYLEQDFQASHDMMQTVLNRFTQAEALARRVKDSSLLWVYIVEWLATASTLFISGFILWSLMIRRKAYRQVKATRLR